MNGGVRHTGFLPGIAMLLTEFVLQPRGPYLFDWYLHRNRISSPIGPFDIELQIDDANRRPPDSRMLNAMSSLRDAFTRDIEMIANLVLTEYRRVANDPAWQDWYPFQNIKTYRGLQRHLRSRGLTVSQDEIDDRTKYPGAVYISPKWDIEHGLHYRRQKSGWVQTDC